MTWVIEDSDGNTSEPIDSEAEAKDQKRSMERFGKDVELKPVGDYTSADSDNSVDDIGADVIEMSGGDGGNENGQGDDDELDEYPEPRPEIKGYGGCVAFCHHCGRFSKEVHRCECGNDLAGQPVYRGDQL